MKKIKSYFQYLWIGFLSLLRVRLAECGLEISDQVLRMAYFDGKDWQMGAVRLEPGVFEKGKLKNADAFKAALLSLRSKISAISDKKEKVNVFMAFSSVNIYSQSFNLPLLEGDDLEKALELNLKMISPIDVAEAYSSSELLMRDESSLRLEMLAAFVEKKTVDDVSKILFETGFLPISAESRAFSLARILCERGSGIDKEKSYLFVDIDNSGLDFLIIRKGRLYFEYTYQWSDLADEKGQIPIEKFQETLTMGMRQVMNFYSQHWPEPLQNIILSAVALEEEAKKVIASLSDLPIIKPIFGTDIAPEWFVAVGCGLRGMRSAGNDKEINLLGETAENTLRREQLIHFLSLWRVIVPAALTLLLLVFIGADIFVINTKAALVPQASLMMSPSDEQEIAALNASATAFNQSISLLQGIESSINPKYKIINEIMNLAGTAGVSVSRISFQGATSPIDVEGSASAEAQIVAFKQSIDSDKNFGPANLPLSAIRISGQSFTFAMTLPLAPNAFQ